MADKGTILQFVLCLFIVVSLQKKLYSPLNGVNTELEVPSLSLSVATDGSYRLLINDKLWFESATTRLFCNNIWHSNEQGNLHLKSTTKFSGSDPTLGRFNAQKLTYLANDAIGETPWEITFSIFLDNPVVLFEQHFPNGANQTALPTFGDTPWHELNSETRVSSEFPSFKTSLPSNDLGYLFWTGRFIIAYSGKQLQNISGIETGPIVFFDSDYNSIILSQLSNFKLAMFSTNTSNPSGPALSAGISARVTSYPNGFKQQVMLYYNKGITNTIYSWGQTMQRVYKLNDRLEDKILSHISYWTDNGAYYYFGAWPNMTSQGLPQNVLVDVNTYLLSLNITIGVMQIDAYWYYMGSPSACINKWVSNPSIFPNGIKWMSEQMPNPVTFSLYSHFFCVNNSYESQYKFMTSDYWKVIWGEGIIQVVDPSYAYDLYHQMYEYGSGNAMSNFRIDFLDFIFLTEPNFQSKLGYYDQWVKGVCQVTDEYKVPIEFCMPLPSDILETLKYPAITTARVSDDFQVHTNWNIGSNSLLPWAVDLAPNKDTFWTTAVQPGNPYQNVEPIPEIPTIIAILSTGPVGISDKIGYTNATLVKRTMNSGGLLLKPSKPATSIDSTFDINPSKKVNGSVWESFSEVNKFYWFYILGINVINYNLKNSDFWPVSPLQQDHVQYYYSKFSDENILQCSNGTKISQCVTLLGSEKDLPNLNTGMGPNNITRNFGYWRFFAVSKQSGWGLLGELDKYVSVSPNRFTSVDYKENGIEVKLQGAPFEIVNLWFVTPENGGTILYSKIPLSNSGYGLVVYYTS